MMTRHFRVPRTWAVRLLVLSLALPLAGTVSVAPAAAADTAVIVPLSVVRDVLVDEAHGHVFLTGGVSDGIVVRDLDGAAVTTITNQPGSRSMALSADSTRLYVALNDADAVSAIDTSTLTEVARYHTGVGSCPSTVAVAAGMVWFGYRDCTTKLGNVGSIDVTTTPASISMGLIEATSNGEAPGLAAPPASTGALLLSRLGDKTGLQLADTSTGSLVLGASRAVPEISADVSFTPEGDHVLAPVWGAGIVSMSVVDLTTETTFGGTHPTALASGAGGAAAIVETIQPVLVYHRDGPLLRTLGISDCCSSPRVAAGGMAFSQSGTLYAVSDSSSGKLVLHVFHNAGKALSVLGFTTPNTTLSINTPYALNGKITSSMPLPSGTPVSIQRDGPYGSASLAPSTTGANGAFVIQDTVSKRGTYGYTASYSGDSHHLGVTRRVAVVVKGLTTTVSVQVATAPYPTGGTALVVAHLGTTRVRTLSIYAQPYPYTSKTRLKTGTVDSKGNISVYSGALTRRTNFIATFAGDDTYEPQSAAKAVLVKGVVRSSLSGRNYYGTSGGYKLFHTGKGQLYESPKFSVTVLANNAGACVRIEAQIYSSGAWRDAASLSCGVLGYDSNDSWYFVSTRAPTYKFRLRATFRGGRSNTAATGSWVYGKITT